MGRFFLVFPLFVIFSGSLFAQNTPFQNHLQKGISLYDHGQYVEALVEYQQALTIDPNSGNVNYEMGNTYSKLQNYTKAIEYYDNAIRINDDVADLAYAGKGNTQDDMKNPDAALQTYKLGLTKFPNSYMLLLNAGITSSKLGNISECSSYAARAVKAGPKRATCHYLLDSSMALLSNRPFSLMALYYFLLLEPDTKRSEKALAVMDLETKKNVEKENDSSVTITVSHNENNEIFTTVDLAISLSEAVQNEDKNKTKSKEDNFRELTESIFTILDNADKNEKNNAVWWTVYTPLFHELLATRQVEAFCYYITAIKNDPANEKWRKDHKKEMDAFIKWREDYFK